MNTKGFTLSELLVVLAVLAVLVAIPCGILFQPYMEMKTFNKMTTGPKATLIDAMFGELRVNSQ